MRRIVVRRARPGIWVAGIEWHPNWVSFHSTWAEAMEQVPAYVAARDHEQRVSDALGAAFDRAFPPRLSEKHLDKSPGSS